MVKNQEMFINGLKALAKKCGYDMTEWDYEAYTSVFEPLGYEKGMEAIKHAFLGLNPRHGMPSPYDLLETIGLKRPDAPTMRDNANDIASLIIDAISKYGGYRATAARDHLGEEAWEVVVGFGGWETLCMTEIDQLPIIRAQMRDLAESKAKIGYHRTNHEALTPGNRLKEIEGIIGGLLKN